MVARHWFLIVFLLGCLGLNAQENPLHRKISIQANQQILETVLNEIARKGQFYYSYNAAGINLNKKVSILANGKTVSYCLTQVLEPETKLRSGRNHVIILPPGKSSNTSAKKGAYLVEGTIRDARTGKAVKYASVLEAGQLKSTMSDQDGHYRIELNNEPEYLQLLVSRKTYRDTVLSIKPRSSGKIDVRIQPAAIEDLNSIPPEIPNQLAENGLFQAVVSDEQLRLTENLALFDERLFQIGFIPTLGSNRNFGGLVENHISLNVLGGYSMALSGVEVAGVFNITRRYVKGVQIGGFMNLTGGATKGLQISGFMNNNIGSVSGVQSAGFYNLSLDSLNGVQTAGFFNMARGRVKGAQASGFMNISGKELDGVQLAGFLNISGREVDGAQLSGFANIASGDFNGLQVGGFLNLSTGDMKGAQLSSGINIVADSSKTFQAAGIANFAGTIQGSQISSLFNIAGKVGGSQIGLINLCDTVSGFTFGLLSLVNKGYHKAEISSGDVNPVLFTLRTGTHKLYNVVSAGMFATSNFNYISFGYGLGTEFRARKKFFFGLDVVTSALFNEQFDFSQWPDLWARTNLYVGYSPVKWMQFFAGPTLNAYRIDQLNLNGNRPGVERSDLFFYNRSDARYYGWMGWQAGIRFF